jgi:molybdopterin-guanine dinucleotide biosynthesis protein A
MTTAAILIGGRARRYAGTDKSALLVGGRTILERQLSALQGVVDEVLIVGRSDQQPMFAARFIADRTPDTGPLGGLDAALAEAASDHVLLLACDMPFLSSAFLRALLTQAPGADAVVPKTERGYHPLCAVYARSCQARVTEHLKERRLRMLDLLNALRVRTVDERDLAAYGRVEQLLANVNTPADFNGLETLHGHKL